MISMVQPLFAGNALRLFVEPPAGAVRWKVLRKGSDSFGGHDDPSAFVAYEGNERVFVDTVGLVNEMAAFYRPFYTSDGANWTAGPTAYGTPSAAYEDQATDVLAFLRERLEAGLRVEVDRRTIVHELGYVPVFTAFPSLDRDVPFPFLTVHLENEEPSVRGIGEEVPGFAIGEDDGWEKTEGWLADVRVTVIAWSMNGDERDELKRAIRRIVQANLPVFADRGWQQIGLTQQHAEDFTSMPAPVYQVFNTFTCIAPAVVSASGPAAPIREITARSNP